MSWGEVTCKKYGECTHGGTPLTCNKDCQYYQPEKSDEAEEEKERETQ